MAECFTNGGTKVKMPDVGDNTIVFDQYYQQQVAPYCIYADFESVLKRILRRKQYMKSLGTLSVLSHHMKKHRLIPIKGQMQEKFLWKNLKA